LGVYANPAGLKRARAEALEVASALAMNNFGWGEWLKQSSAPLQTAGEWVKAFEAQYFTERARTPKTETTWDKDYRLPFAKLPQDETLTAAMLLEAIALTKPDTRERLRRCTAYGALAKFAGIALDVSKLRGKYSPKTVQPRDLPSDELIAEWRDRIPDEGWRWVYSMIAAYGLRPHEAFLIDPDSVRRSPLIRVTDGKTGYRAALPVLPEWWEGWQLSDIHLPGVTARANRDYGLRAGQYFKRLGLPFKLYDLRHAWAARVARMGLPVSIAAKLQGHSPDVHSQVYQQFMDESHLLASWELLKNQRSF
jgi:integrase